MASAFTPPPSFRGQAPDPSPGERGYQGEFVMPGEGGGFQGCGGPSAPRILEILHTLSARLRFVEDSCEAESLPCKGGQGVRREMVLPHALGVRDPPCRADREARVFERGLRRPA